MKYLVSLKHTNIKDEKFTLWRPNNRGYCWYKEWAGVYKNIENGYHDNDHTIPIDADSPCFNCMERGENGEWLTYIQNNATNMALLGIKKTRKGFVRL